MVPFSKRAKTIAAVRQGAVDARRGLHAPRAGATDGGTAVSRRTVRVLRHFLLLVSRAAPCLCCRATGDTSFLNVRLHFLRSGACYLLLGGRMYGLEMHVGRGTD